MMDGFVIKDLTDLDEVPTSHNAGLKRVLLSRGETRSKITQIAVTTLKAGEVAETHSHSDMEEFFLFYEGRGKMRIGDCDVDVCPGRFVGIPIGVAHEVQAVTDLRFQTIGVEL